jgi:hypothetical protein
MFSELKPRPADPILGLSVKFKADSHPQKIDLGAGIYKDETGHTPRPSLAEVVRQWCQGVGSGYGVGIGGGCRYSFVDSNNFCELSCQYRLAHNSPFICPVLRFYCWIVAKSYRRTMVGFGNGGVVIRA